LTDSYILYLDHYATNNTSYMPSSLHITVQPCAGETENEVKKVLRKVATNLRRGSNSNKRKCRSGLSLCVMTTTKARTPTVVTPRNGAPLVSTPDFSHLTSRFATNVLTNATELSPY